MKNIILIPILVILFLFFVSISSPQNNINLFFEKYEILPLLILLGSLITYGLLKYRMKK
jgi:uncharacterized integral membrane protein